MNTVYHVTFTKNVSKIRKKGIVPFQPSLWIKAGDRTRYGGGEIYAFEHKKDAIRWAAKMDWEFYKQTGTGKISIITIKAPDEWDVDTADPLGQAGAKGKWLKRIGMIKPGYVVEVEPVTLDLVRTLNEHKSFKVFIAERAFKSKDEDNIRLIASKARVRFFHSHDALRALEPMFQDLWKTKKKPPLLPNDRFALYGDCGDLAYYVAGALRSAGYEDAEKVGGPFRGPANGRVRNRKDHCWVEIPSKNIYVDPSQDQYHNFFMFHVKPPRIKDRFPNELVRVGPMDAAYQKFYKVEYRAGTSYGSW